MSALLERLEREAVILGRGQARGRELRYRPITHELLDANARAWRDVDAEIRRGGDPTALIGGLAGLESGSDVLIADGSAITGGTSNVALWDSRQYTPIPPLTRRGVIYELDAEGTITSSGAAQTVTLNPHIGPSNTVGTNLTAAPAQTLGSTITNAVWRLWAQITLRSVGAGTAATAVGGFRFEYSTAANAGSPTTVIWRSSGGAATFDSTALNGLVMGVTPSNSGVSIVVRQIKWGSWG
jgi:hypothetical protein